MIAGACAFPRRLIVNGASIFAGEASARLATVLMAAVIARRFGSVALGEYGYALAITSVLLVNHPHGCSHRLRIVPRPVHHRSQSACAVLCFDDTSIPADFLSGLDGDF